MWAQDSFVLSQSTLNAFDRRTGIRLMLHRRYRALHYMQSHCRTVKRGRVIVVVVVVAMSAWSAWTVAS